MKPQNEIETSEIKADEVIIELDGDILTKVSGGSIQVESTGTDVGTVAVFEFTSP